MYFAFLKKKKTNLSSQLTEVHFFSLHVHQSDKTDHAKVLSYFTNGRPDLTTEITE